MSNGNDLGNRGRFALATIFVLSTAGAGGFYWGLQHGQNCLNALDTERSTFGTRQGVSELVRAECRGFNIR